MFSNKVDLNIIMLRAMFVLAVFVAVVSVAYPQDTYSDKYDDQKLDALLNNEDNYQKFFKCLANRGPCSPEDSFIKSTLPEVLQNNCSKCTEKQKENGMKLFTYLWTKKRSDYEVLANIYDPEGIYRQKYADIAKKKLGA